ncbi:MULTISPECIES: invasion associated locus B family protein [unclassified Ruegeria]|uniref:invasion associated locus B family protein n=1 Tax=unclassified Ruegeria TaxID=2625375 RepID=UPI0014885AD6|nr:MULTISPECIES: invasion associated locus B family protein [unclassified Ruegeria]NOD63350.1 invasion associated locus B family protein [Ruegeria sp. HKCCD6109]NOD75398.1 invasion associated locus B family protein [Ruegeria sp. HKCCD4332]NOD87359.1 invasion associated locus B family protein [Ruegeria sp. HKCCD4318]NOD91478.1 invasion associated locus B family protein [Ruegeria sp. HKCCD4884]NOE12914.1 invasion associated locus B family protein [Ruegeria sp. HKCCD4318-2]
MIKKLLSANVLAAAFVSSAAFAQETTDDTQAQTEVPQTQATQELDLGESGPRVGDQYVKEESGDWNITCLKTEGDNDPCLLRQILSGAEGQPVAEISVNKLPEGATAVAAASLIVPLETLLQAQIAISIDGAPSKRYNYHHCNPVGCVAQLGFTQGDIDAMKGGSTATISMVSILAPNQLLQIEMSLAGFTSGYDKLDVLQN